MYNAVILTESQLRFVIGRRVSHGISIWKKNYYKFRVNV